MASEHTAKAFDSDLQELTRLVAEMGGLAERMIVDSIDALIRRDAGAPALRAVELEKPDRRFLAGERHVGRQERRGREERDHEERGSFHG